MYHLCRRPIGGSLDTQDRQREKKKRDRENSINPVNELYLFKMKCHIRFNFLYTLHFSLKSSGTIKSEWAKGRENKTKLKKKRSQNCLINASGMLP